MQAHAKKLVIGAGIAGMASMLWAALSMKGGS
jgi:cation diffusion facilitator CzcD-associated flavoprotein CzcO